jgi:hypothetical protein
MRLSIATFTRSVANYIYLGLITGEHPDPDRAARVINALLPGGPKPHQAKCGPRGGSS